MIVIVMGVSGSGKSYFAARLAEATGWAFAEGDDYHSPANKAKMHAGIALTDEDRAPWLDTLHGVLLNWHRTGQSGILTCSALKAAYRQHLTGDLPETRYIWLDPPREVIAQRMTERPGHFMPPELLASQLATLERPEHDPSVLRLDGSEPIPEAIQTIIQWILAPQ